MKETLYTSELSPFGSRLRLVGALTKRDEVQILSPPGGTGSAEMKEINPFGQIPTLVVDGIVLIESLALMEYFIETSESASLLAADAVSRARIRGICRAHDNQVIAAMAPLFVQLRTASPDTIIILETFKKIELKLTDLVRLFDNQGFVIGHSLSIADIAIVPFAFLTNILAARFSQISPYANMPRLTEWWRIASNIAEIAAELTRLQAAMAKAFA